MSLVSIASARRNHRLTASLPAVLLVLVQAACGGSAVKKKDAGLPAEDVDAAVGGTGGRPGTGGTAGRPATGGSGGSVGTGGAGGSAAGGSGGGSGARDASSGETGGAGSGGTRDASAGDAARGDAVTRDATMPTDARTGDSSASAMMSFFVTSTGTGPRGGNLGGLAGGDAKCQMHATAVGAGGKTWRAYLSAAGANARDRIGMGPWFNQRGQMVAMNVTTLLQGGIPANMVLTEIGTPVPGNQHDIITGTRPDGTVFADRTCMDWTSMSGQVQVQVGHSDGAAGANRFSAHASTCSQEGLIATAGAGRLYCFATN